MDNLVEIEDLRVSFQTYGGSVQAVRGISLAVKPGECLAVVGESGCGKSVTAQTLLRLIPAPPAEISGRILFEGSDLLALPERRMEEIRGGQIGMIFQDPMTSLNPTMQMGRQITEGLREHHPRMKKAEAKRRAIEVLTQVGIPEPERQLKRYAYEFSGGMRQRAVIAMAIICRPRLLIADEPTTALDVTTQAQILDLIRQLKQETGMAVMLITHDMGVVSNMAERIAVFYAGQVVEEGTAEGGLRAPRPSLHRGPPPFPAAAGPEPESVAPEHSRHPSGPVRTPGGLRFRLPLRPGHDDLPQAGAALLSPGGGPQGRLLAAPRTVPFAPRRGDPRTPRTGGLPCPLNQPCPSSRPRSSSCTSTCRAALC